MEYPTKYPGCNGRQEGIEKRDILVVSGLDGSTSHRTFFFIGSISDIESHYLWEQIKILGSWTIMC